MEEENFNSEWPEIEESVQTQQEPSVDEELTEHKAAFEETTSEIEKLELRSDGGPLGEYYKAAKSLSSWMLAQSSKIPAFPQISTSVDPDALNIIDETLLRLGVEIISKGTEYKEIKNQGQELLKNDANNSNLIDINNYIEQLWDSFNGIFKASKLKLREFRWIADIRTKVDTVDFEIKKVEAMLEGVQESRNKTHNDGKANSESSSNSGDVVTSITTYSSSLLDEWYTKVIAVEELAHDVIEKVNDAVQLYRQNPRFRAPQDLAKCVEELVDIFIPALKSKISDTKQIFAHDRRIARYFDGGNKADEWISETLNRVKQLEVPDFINKSEWEEEEQNIQSIVEARRKMIENIAADVDQFRQSKIEELVKRSEDIIEEIRDSTDQEDQTVVQLMTKRLKALEERLEKLSNSITLLLSQTTTETYTTLLVHLKDLQAMRTRMQNIRKVIREHNDADLVANDVSEVEKEITDFKIQLPQEDSALAKVLLQKHANILVTIQNTRMALAENRLEMAAYLSPSSPSSPTSSASDFDRLSMKIQTHLESFKQRLLHPPTYLVDTDSTADEPVRVHGLTCSDDHIEEFTEKYGSIESELTSFERSLWVEFWLSSERAKRIRGQEAINRIDELEADLAEVKKLMSDRNQDLLMVKDGRVFAKEIYKVRDELDNAKGKMRRGEATTDASIQELDQHMAEARRLLDNLQVSHDHLITLDTQDSSYQEKYDEYQREYTIAQDWIEEVRTWFKEAERIRMWIEKRNEILENVPQVDVFQEGQAPATQEQVDLWQKDYEELEKEVEKFNAEDMSRLRAHVQEIMDIKVEAEKAMSPANAMTMAITLQTLTILGKLTDMLKHRENELALLALRVQWEREFNGAMRVWEGLVDEIKELILNRGRWKPPVSTTDDWPVAESQPSQKDVISESRQIDRKIGDYEANTIPPTSEIFDRFVDTSTVEVPEHLLMRQQNLEEDELDALKVYFTFLNKVITQRKEILDYVQLATAIHKDGTRLKQDLIKEEENPRGGSVEKKYLARVQEINDRVETLWANKGSRIMYPEHERHDESENETVRGGVKLYYKKMKELLSAIGEALKAYQRALRFVKMAEEYKKEAARLEQWMADQNALLKKRKVDVFAPACPYSKKDVETFFDDNILLSSDVDNFETQDLTNLHQKVSALVAEVKAVGTKCVNTDELDSMMKTLDEKLAQVRENIGIHVKELHVLDKRVDWENLFSDAGDWLDSANAEAQQFLTDQARWHADNESPNETLLDWLSAFKSSLSDFKENSLKNTQIAFTNLCDIFNTLLEAETAPEHIHKRQKNLENKLESLKLLAIYTGEVLKQRQAVLNYMNEAGDADKFGSKIQADLEDVLNTILTEGKDDDTDFIERIALYKERIDKAWKELAVIVPYPARAKDDNSVSEVDSNKNPDDVHFNASVREALEKENLSLQALSENLDELLMNFQRSIALYRTAKAYEEKAKELDDWVMAKIPIIEARCIDVFSDNFSSSKEEVDKLRQENAQMSTEVQTFEADEVVVLREKIQNLLQDIEDARAKNIDTEPLTSVLRKLNEDLERLQKMLVNEENEVDAADKRIDWEESYKHSSELVDASIKETKGFIESKATWRPDTPEDTSTIESLSSECSEIEVKVAAYMSNEIASNKSNYGAFIIASDKLADKERREGIENRQAQLDTNVTKSNDHVVYSRDLLNQRFAVVKFLSEATKLETVAAEIKEGLIEAEKNVSSGPSEVDYEVKVKDFCGNVKTLWESVGSKVPYPTSPIMDQVDHTDNAIVKETVDNRHSLLSELADTLDKLFEKYQTSLALQARANDCLKESERIQDWIAKRQQILIDRQVDPLAEEFPWNEEQVLKIQEEHEEFLKENARVDVEDIYELRKNLESLLDDIVKADCTSVDQAPLREALDRLNQNFSDLQSASSSRQLDLSVLENRARWEDQCGPGSVILDELTKQVNDFISDQARWSPETKEPLNNLENLFSELESKVKEFEEKQLATMRSTFNDMETSIKSLLSKETPKHLTDRQIVLNQKFADLLARMTLAKDVLAQREAIDAYLKQADLVEKEGHALKSKIISAEENGEPDPGFAEMLASFKNNLVDLKNNLIEKITYPNDPQISEDPNSAIKQIVGDKLATLETLSDELDGLLKSYQDTMDLTSKLSQVLEEAKDIESELDKFIFEKATWESNQDSVGEETADAISTKLLSHLDAIKANVLEFDLNKLSPVNNKYEDYKSIMEASSKNIPGHVQNRHETLNNLMDGLKKLDDFARDVIKQRSIVDQYMQDGAQLEREAQQLQQILLSNQPSSPGGEGNTISTTVNGFANRVHTLWTDVVEKITYPACPIQNEENRVGHADDCNSVVEKAINAQNESLKSLAHSLEDLLNTHQNLLRRKKMVETYMKQAEDVATWIRPKLETVETIIHDRTLGEKTQDYLGNLQGDVEGIDASRLAYHSAFEFAKSLADRIIQEMTDEVNSNSDDIEDIKADLKQVTARQQEIEALWDALQTTIPLAKQILDQGLQIVEFKQKVDEIFVKIDELSELMTNSEPENITDADKKEWQTRLNLLEQDDFFSLVKQFDNVQENLKENPSVISGKESKVIEDRLQEVNDKINALKKLRNRKCDEADAYRSSQMANAYMNRANDLQNWINGSISKFLDARKYGIMVGDSEDLNNNNWSTLKSIFDDFTKELPNRFNDLESIREEFQNTSSLEGIRELQELIKCNTELNNAWENLDPATADFQEFVQAVEKWYDRHGEIYRVEDDILGGLDDRIDNLKSIGYDALEAEVKELEDRLKKAEAMLKEVKEAASQIVDKEGESIDQQNRKNLDGHHDSAVKRHNILSAKFQIALAEALNASALAAFHADANRIIADCGEGKGVVQSRHEELDRIGYYALEVEVLEKVLKDAIQGYNESDEKLSNYDRQVNESLKKEADQLIERNSEANKERVLNIFGKVTEAFQQFSDAVSLERQELELVRDVYTHAKAAQDIKSWISACKMAALNIQVDVINQEPEIADLEEKVATFQQTVDQFKRMGANILAPKADIDASQSEEYNPKIRDSIQQRTDRVLDDWQSLKDLLSSVRTSLNASKENQEVSRTIKDILLAIRQVKERVLDIESYITSEGIVKVPTREDIDNGERELDEIQAEVDHILQPRIEGLDEMINNLIEGGANFVQQRASIAEALTNLASIIENKRNQLQEAQKLAVFGSKADEMDALMSSLMEVVVDASTTPDKSSLSSLPMIELQKRSIELDTKYSYYKPKILEKLKDAKEAAEAVKDDWRVEERLGNLSEQWKELDQEANAKREELKRLLSGQKARPTRSSTSRSSTLARTTRSPSPASSRLMRRTVISPSPNNGLRKQRPSPSKTPTRQTPSPTPGQPGSPRRPPIRLLPHTVNNYVPDPKDPLDVEVARIVNACPVKIKVSMVDGEPGKYTFGEVDPKLCYCRILRSRMVMVRVGGGWAELSKFLVEHANLEQKYIPKARSFVGLDEPSANHEQASSGPSFYEENSKRPEFRIPGEKDGHSLALKPIMFTRKNQEFWMIWVIGLAIFFYGLIALKERGNTWDTCELKNKQFLICT